MKNLAGIVLAAGVSSRMGKFKPLLQVDGQTMAQRVVSLMQQAGADPVIVVTGYQAQQLEEHLENANVVFVKNPRYYTTQMLDSLVLGLSALSPSIDRVLLSPVDIPLVQPETIQALLAARGDFIRPTCQGTPGHPVVLSCALTPLLRSYQGEGGLWGAIQSAKVVPCEIPVDDFGTMLDSDTKDEYAQLLRYHREQTQLPQALQLDLQIRLQAETSFWGPDTAQFLDLIHTTGSILSACQCMHLSYSKGWKTINEIEHQLGYPVLYRNQGGSHGGGSELTHEGLRLLHTYQQMQQEITRASQQIYHRYFPNGKL